MRIRHVLPVSLPRVYWRESEPLDSPLLRPARAVAREGVALFRGAADFLNGLVLKTLPLEGALIGSVFLPPGQNAPVPVSQSELEIQDLDKEIESLIFRNKGSSPVAILPGHLFKGGFQNRMVQNPVILGPGEKSAVPVFCVEAGRWAESLNGISFEPGGRLPDLLLHHYRMRRWSGEASARTQLWLWEAILEALTYTDCVNSTMDIRSSLRENDDTGLSDAAFADLADGSPRGVFSVDPAAAMSSLSIYPAQSFHAPALSDFRRELAWRRLLRRRISGARAYFRVFDEKKRVAVRCMADGRPLKDLRGRPIAFTYTDDDLKHSFVPPGEEPPGGAFLNLSNEKHFESPDEFLEALRDCRAKLFKTPNGTAFRFVHPELSLHGDGLIVGKELAILDASAHRPFA